MERELGTPIERICRFDEDVNANLEKLTTLFVLSSSGFPWFVGSRNVAMSHSSLEGGSCLHTWYSDAGSWSGMA